MGQRAHQCPQIELVRHIVNTYNSSTGKECIPIPIAYLEEEQTHIQYKTLIQKPLCESYNLGYITYQRKSVKPIRFK